MEVADAFALISDAIDAGRAANGYLVAGDIPKGLDLADRILRKLYPNELEQIERKCHPDVAVLEPSGRAIKVDDMREKIVAPMAVTAYSGGWKVGLVVHADRMEAPTANAFLKTLEEPPPKTVFLLLTDAADKILPTIVSRTQRIDLPLGETLLEDEAYDTVAGVFASAGAFGVCERAQMAETLAATLEELVEAAKDAEEDLVTVRRTFFKTVLSFVSRWMREGRLPAYAAYRNVNAVEEASRQVERAVPSDAAIALMMDRITFPVS